MHDPPPQDRKEGRRLQAYELKQQGWKQTDIAEAMGVTDGAVSQWMKTARSGGKEALRSKKHPGPKRRLEADELHEKLPDLLRKGAEHYGFRGRSGRALGLGRLSKRSSMSVMRPVST